MYNNLSFSRYSWIHAWLPIRSQSGYLKISKRCESHSTNYIEENSVLLLLIQNKNGVVHSISSHFERINVKQKTVDDEQQTEQTINSNSENTTEASCCELHYVPEHSFDMSMWEWVLAEWSIHPISNLYVNRMYTFYAGETIIFHISHFCAFMKRPHTRTLTHPNGTTMKDDN